MVETRAEELHILHQSRLDEQRKRQHQLRLKQTPAEVKSIQVSNASKKVLKRAAKAGAFENSYSPNEDWNKKLDTDMVRHQKSRALESDEKRKLRKEKDADYQREKGLIYLNNKEGK